jgi:uncharacterized repeat protein (TIGR03803 family)
VALCLLTIGALAWSAVPAFAQASFTKITDFPSTDAYGAYNAAVQGPDGAFYGVTYYGGASSCNCGTIYRIDQYGVETILHSFTGYPSDGANPEFVKLLLAADGNFWGTTITGGANNQGSIFKISPSGTYSLVFSFNNSASPATGTAPYGGLVLGSDGKLWGAASSNGPGGTGTIFNITTGGTFTMAHALAGYNGTTYPEGGYPYGGLAAATNGKLYGVAWNYGTTTSYQGTLFSVDPATSTFTVLHSFLPYDSGGCVCYPEGYSANNYWGPVQGSDGKIYIPRGQGGLNAYGQIDSYDPSSSTFAVVHNIAAYNGTIYPEGYYLYAGLFPAADGKLYGQTYSGGAYGGGVVFSLATDGTYSVVHNVRNSPNQEGATAYGELSQTSSGALLGTNTGGAASGNGELFTVNTDGSGWNDIHDFYSTPANPLESAIRASDGLLYATSAGGSGCGTVFRIEADGTTIQTLHVFGCGDPTDGQTPYGRLVEGSDGALYGTTYQGGSNGYGTVYRITKLGQFSLLHSFYGYNSGTGIYEDGLYPYSGLIVATDGNMYGTTNSYGHYGYGTIYQITTGGTFSVVHSFNNAAGEGAYTFEGGVVQGPDGRLYGTTYGGGSHGYGTLFAVTTGGSFTKLHDFDPTGIGEGYQSHGQVAFDGAGNVYGTTYYGGYDGVGTIFKWHASGGALEILKHFYQDDDGCYPYGGLTMGHDGLLYGTTSQCGTRPSFGDYGTFFSITTDGATFVNLFDFNSTSGSASGALYRPESTPFEDTPGNFIGSAYYGGTSSRGGIYKITLFTVKVLSPNGGETMYDDTPYKITWDATGGTGGVNHFDLALSIDGGTTWNPISGCTGVSGSARSCVFSSPGPMSTKARVRVTAFDNGGHSLNDSSDANFSIKTGSASFAKLKVTAPKAGGNLGIGTHQLITWSHDLGATESFNLDYSTDGGSTWHSIATNVPALTSAKGTYTWVVPNAASANAFVRVTGVHNGISALSGVPPTGPPALPFTIATPFITVNPSPTWHDGTPATIHWKSNLGTLENVKIELSNDGGASFTTTINASTPADGTDVETVQASWNTIHARLRISWVGTPSVNGVSAKDFVIQP